MAVEPRATGAQPGAPAPSPVPVVPSRARFVLGILLVVYIFNFIDRQILSILLPSIKEDLQLSDTALGWLTGFAFAIFYTVVGIPVARWADSGSRRTIITIGLALWSLMTAASGLARSFTHLLVARIGVGVGEAACSPPAHSMLADLYPPEQRGRALGIYAMGIPIGVFFGYLIGGWIDEFFGWRTAFLVVGLPGLLLAVIVRLTVPEPKRGDSEGIAAEGQQLESVWTVFRFLWARRSFRHLSFAAALHAFVGYGAGAFNPSFLVRSHDMGIGVIGTWLAFTALLAGGLGTYLGGFLSDRFGARDARFYVWVPALATVAAVPFVGLFYVWPAAIPALLFNVPSAVAGPMYLGPTFAMTQSMVRVRMRALASAILLFVINLVGLGAGPWAVGVVSDLLVPRFGEESLRYALLGIGVPGYLWSAVHYVLAARTLREDLQAKNR